MNIGRIISLVVMGECLLAAIAYACQKDWRHSLYWASCFGIYLAVTI